MRIVVGRVHRDVGGIGGGVEASPLAWWDRVEGIQTRRGEIRHLIWDEAHKRRCRTKKCADDAKAKKRKKITFHKGLFKQDSSRKERCCTYSLRPTVCANSTRSDLRWRASQLFAPDMVAGRAVGIFGGDGYRCDRADEPNAMVSRRG